jgi:hypothetical protein
MYPGTVPMRNCARPVILKSGTLHALTKLLWPAKGGAGRQERRGTSLLLRWGSTSGIRALGSVNIRLHGSILHIGLERALSAVHQQRTGPLQQCTVHRAGVACWMPAGRYSKQRRRKKDRSAAAVGAGDSNARRARPAAAQGSVDAAEVVGSVVVRHSIGLTIESNAKLVHTTASLTRHSATARDRTVSVATLVGALRQQPISTLYPELTEEYVGVLTRWKDRFSPVVWTRMTKHGTDRTPRCVKEMNECAPVVIAVREAIRRRASADSAPTTIVDLCSGFGFLGMLLSEVLEPEAVERIHLVDQMWPMANAKESGPTQITWEHIHAPGWPIPLRTRKTNLKKGAEMRQLEKYIIGSASGSVIVAGVHLCGALAIKAIELFNRRRDKIAMICLKPCCLPGRIHAAREESWTVSPSLSLCTYPFACARTLVVAGF